LAVGIFTLVLVLVVLVFCWIVGEQSLLTKLIFTGLTFLTFGLCLLGDWGRWLAMAAQAILTLVIGGTTFGADWLKRRL
jgi:hypothetical protein